jgi:hypothetical protein
MAKKDMRKKSISSSSVLVQLYNNRKVCTKVDNMLDEGQTYDYIIEFCKENGITISKASLTNYKKKREEAIETGTPLLQLLDKRAKDNVTYIKSKEVDTLSGNTKGSDSSNNGQGATVHDISKVGQVYNDIELLDEIIAKGAKGLRAFDVVDTPLAMKAIELKAKITGNQLNGLSVAGLRELKMRMLGKESAMTEVIMKYVPAEHHDALFEDLRAAEEEFYENLDLTEEEKRITSALRLSGADL